MNNFKNFQTSGDVHIGQLSSYQKHVVTFYNIGSRRLRRFLNTDEGYVKETRRSMIYSDFSNEDYFILFKANFLACNNLSKSGINFGNNSIGSGFLSLLSCLILSTQVVVDHAFNINSSNNQTTIPAFFSKLMLNIGNLRRSNGDVFGYGLDRSLVNFESIQTYLGKLYDLFRKTDPD